MTVEFEVTKVDAMLQAIWNWFLPFSVMKDASRGTMAEQAAALRYNREKRGCLTTYISRWLWSFTAALLLVGLFDAMAPVFVLVAAAFAMFAATAVCAICLLSYAYAYLTFAAARSTDPGPRP